MPICAAINDRYWPTKRQNKSSQITGGGCQSGTICVMKHRPFNVLAGMSLLLSVLAAAMWIDSASHDIWWSYLGTPDPWEISRLWHVSSSDGRLDVGWLEFGPGANLVSKGGFRFEVQPVPSIPPPPTYLHLDEPEPYRFIGFYVGRQGGFFRGPVLGIPDWFLILVALLLPLRWLKKPRTRRGICSSCGYDLRATPDRCPECGTQTLQLPI